MMSEKFDGIIFDMDGTLWDAVDSYCTIWNVTLMEFGIKAEVTRDRLLSCMGLTIDAIFDRIFGGQAVDRNSFLRLIAKNEDAMMPGLGGVLYDGVKDGIARLSERYRLFMVSNCGSDGLKNFLIYTGLTSYVEGTLTNGETGLDKAANLRLLVERYSLSSPVYVGDIQRDCDAAHVAGMPFVWASYGFGTCRDYDYKVKNFVELVKMFDAIHER